MLVGVGAVLVAAFALQLVGYRHGGHTSLSDLPRVFRSRGVGPTALPYIDRPIEYPVLAGVLLYAASLVWASPLGVLVVTALLASWACAVVTVLLARRFGTRAWRWVLAVPLLLYAFQNWDVFAITALVVGVLAYERVRDGLAGAAFGVGAAVKLFPAAAVVPLAARRWAQGDRRGAGRLVGAAAAAFVAVNLPVLLANPAGWWWPFSFQSRRDTTWGSAWFYLFRLGRVPVHGLAGAHVANLVSAVALAAGLLWCAHVTVRRQLTPFAATAIAVTVFVLCNKVYSPTYDVWLVVVFVMVPLARRLWLTFCAVDLAVFVTVYGYFESVVPRSTVVAILPVLVVVRTAVLLTVIRRSACDVETPRVALRRPARVAER